MFRMFTLFWGHLAGPHPIVSRLKHEQDLKIGFGAFEDNLIQLLALCASEGAKSVPKFILRLEVFSATELATLKIIETNPFKNLCHLSLRYAWKNFK